MTPFAARATLRSRAEACRARARELCGPAAHYLLVAAAKLDRAAVLAHDGELLAERAEERDRGSPR